MKMQSKSTGKPGRKPLPPHRVHGNRLVIKLRDDQLDQIAKEAQSKDKDVSTWARETLLKAIGT